jgi:hypothetical protein
MATGDITGIISSDDGLCENALKCNISHQGTFVSKNAYEKFGVFNTNYRYSMDMDLLMRFEHAGAKFKYVDTTLAYLTFGGLTFTKYSSKRRRETE